MFGWEFQRSRACERLQGQGGCQTRNQTDIYHLYISPSTNRERLRQPAERGAEMRRIVVPELGDQRMLLEHGLHDRALRAATAPVHQSQFAKAFIMRSADVLIDHRRDIAWREGVKIELRFDGDDVRIPGVGHARLTYSATTDVVMPPLAVNAPVTVIRRGLHTATRSSRMRLVTAS